MGWGRGQGHSEHCNSAKVRYLGRMRKEKGQKRAACEGGGWYCTVIARVCLFGLRRELAGWLACLGFLPGPFFTGGKMQ